MDTPDRHRRYLRARPWHVAGMALVAFSTLGAFVALVAAIPVPHRILAYGGAPLGLAIIAAGEIVSMGPSRWRWLRRKRHAAIALATSPGRIGRGLVAAAVWIPFGLASCLLVFPERWAGPLTVRLMRAYDATTSRTCARLGL